MAESNPYAGPRWLAFSMSAIAIVALILAALDTPLTDWSGSNYLFGAILVVFAVAFAVAGARGSFNLIGRWSGKVSMIFAVVGTLGSAAFLIGSLVSGVWNVDSILTTGTWLALLLMFGGSIAVANKKMKAGS